MIRFIDLTNQIVEGKFAFAWFDTETRKFLSLSRHQVWYTWEDFKMEYWLEFADEPAGFLPLFPKERLSN